METKESLRVGIIGFGLSGSVFHAPTISTLPGFELAAIVTDRPDHRAKAESLYPFARVWSDADAFLAHVDGVDVVTVSVTNDLHFEYAARLIDLGVPVIVEKPLASRADLASDLVSLAEAKGSFLTCFQNRRWDGDFLTLKSVIASGRLGRLTRFVSRFEMPQLDVIDGWREDPAPGLAGGVLFDLGVHLVDQAVHLFGEVLEVYAETAISRVGARVDDDSFISLLFANGVRAHLGASKANAKPAARFQLIGSAGTYTKWGLDPQQRQLAAGMLPTDPAYGRSDDASSLTTHTGDEAVPLKPGSYAEFYRGVGAALRTGAPPPVDPADAVYTLRILELARVAASSHQVGSIAVPAT